VNLSLLDRVRVLAAQETGLAVIVTSRADGSAHASVVNAGVIDHPVTGEPVVGFVIQGGARRKLMNLRARPLATVVFRSGWDWVAVEGPVDLIGPDDLPEGLAAEDVRRAFHEIYVAAIGGTAQEWAVRDDEIERERHTAVLVRPTRIYPNPEAGP
jgi:pyridoxamine 5'-phosphate oxidase-like protein